MGEIMIFMTSFFAYDVWDGGKIWRFDLNRAFMPVRRNRILFLSCGEGLSIKHIARSLSQ
jgi:hypothetical protein